MFQIILPEMMHCFAEGTGAQFRRFPCAPGHPLGPLYQQTLPYLEHQHS